MQIRRLDTADALAFHAFRLRGLREHAEAFTSSHDEEVLKPESETARRLAPGSDTTLWGAFVGGELAGIVGLTREQRQQNRHKARLVAMYVAPEHSGQGIGRALVDTVIADARTQGIERIVLTVTAGNPPATALYERAGFVAFGLEADAIRVNGISFGKQHMALALPPSSGSSPASTATPTPESP